jgi:hypothetical protein
MGVSQEELNEHLRGLARDVIEKDLADYRNNIIFAGVVGRVGKGNPGERLYYFYDNFGPIEGKSYIHELLALGYSSVDMVIIYGNKDGSKDYIFDGISPSELEKAVFEHSDMLPTESQKLLLASRQQQKIPVTKEAYDKLMSDIDHLALELNKDGLLRNIYERTQDKHHEQWLDEIKRTFSGKYTMVPPLVEIFPYKIDFVDTFVDYLKKTKEEIIKKFDENKLNQEICNLLSSRVHVKMFHFLASLARTPIDDILVLVGNKEWLKDFQESYKAALLPGEIAFMEGEQAGKNEYRRLMLEKALSEDPKKPILMHSITNAEWAFAIPAALDAVEKSNDPIMTEYAQLARPNIKRIIMGIVSNQMLAPHGKMLSEEVKKDPKLLEDLEKEAEQMPDMEAVKAWISKNKVRITPKEFQRQSADSRTKVIKEIQTREGILPLLSVQSRIKIY